LSIVSWDKVCRPKKGRGLGLRKMKVVNSAFLSKLTWKLFYGESLWLEQMQGKYPIDEIFFCRTKEIKFLGLEVHTQESTAISKRSPRESGKWNEY